MKRLFLKRLFQTTILVLCTLINQAFGAKHTVISNSEYGPVEAVWSVLLIIVEQTDVRGVVVNGEKYSYTGQLPEDEIQAAIRGFTVFPKLTARLTNGRVLIDAHYVRKQGPVTRVSSDGRGGVWLSSNDAREIIQRYDQSGEWDTIAVHWRLGKLPSKYLGWGGAFTPNRATYITITETSPEKWASAFGEELFLHEWIHCIGSYFLKLGFAEFIPKHDADAAENWGYSPDHNGCLCRFYADLLNGKIPYKNGLIGFTRAMWGQGVNTEFSNAGRMQGSSIPSSPPFGPSTGGPPGFFDGPPPPGFPFSPYVLR